MNCSNKAIAKSQNVGLMSTWATGEEMGGENQVHGMREAGCEMTGELETKQIHTTKTKG